MPCSYGGGMELAGPTTPSQQPPWSLQPPSLRRRPRHRRSLSTRVSTRLLEGIINRAANIRAGYVYVISNVGAFGPDVVKIGMTRRLEPLDRVRELGGASVPFRFDVHALIFSEDAVSLENALHHRFAAKRLNLANQRREFFFATPIEVKHALVELRGDLVSFCEDAEALEWHQSENSRRDNVLD